MFRHPRTPPKTTSRTPKKSTSRSNTPIKSSKIAHYLGNTISNTQTSNYFCHYRNAMYMGGIKSFQKHGRGILIHDNGASIISQYYNDMKHGHNIVLYEHCLLSIMYQKNKIEELVMRIPNYLILLRYSTQNNNIFGHFSYSQPDGKGILIDYQTKTLIYFTYRKGSMIDKHIQEDITILAKIFELDSLDFLIGSEHSNALKLQIKKDQNFIITKSSSKATCGFHKKGLINGIGFTMMIKDSNSTTYNLDTHRKNDEFYLKTIERGLFLNSQLSGMGQKHFKNGNLYIGDFKNDIFQGRGILKNNIKNNWVYGEFQGGNLSSLIDFNNEGDGRKCEKIIQAMHQRKNSWIDKQVEVAEPGMFIDQIQKIFETNPKQKIKTLYQKKQQVLKKIQQNFMCDDPNQSSFQTKNNNIDFVKISSRNQTHRKDFQGFAHKFLTAQKGYKQQQQNYQQNNNNQYLSPETYSSPAHSVMVNNSSKNYRHAPLFQKTQKLKQSRNLIKLYDIPTTKDSTERHNKNQVYTRNVENAQSLSRNNDKQIYSTQEGRPKHYNRNLNQLINSRKSNVKYHKISDVKDEGQIMNADSRKIISKSRIFKYLNNDDTESPPSFSYVSPS